MTGGSPRSWVGDQPIHSLEKSRQAVSVLFRLSLTTSPWKEWAAFRPERGERKVTSWPVAFVFLFLTMDLRSAKRRW